MFSSARPPSTWTLMYPVWAFWCGGPRHLPTPGPRQVGRAQGEPRPGSGGPGLGRRNSTSPCSEEVEPVLRGIPWSSYPVQCPSIVDAQYTKNQAWKSSKIRWGWSQPRRSQHWSPIVNTSYLQLQGSLPASDSNTCSSVDRWCYVGDEWLEFLSRHEA